MYEQKEDSSWSFAIGLFFGAATGAALASLFVPRSGQQNREAVLERGLVIKERVTDRASSMTTSVKGTTTSAVSSVKETTTSAVSSVKDATNTAVTKVSDTVTQVKEAASSAVEKVSTAASTAVEKVQDVASTTVEKVSETTSVAVEKVSTVASTAAEKVQDVAATATDKARSLTSRSHDDSSATVVLPSAATLVSEASYDAEDVRPVTTTAALPPLTMPVETTYVSQAEAARGMDLEEEIGFGVVPLPEASISSPEVQSAIAELSSDEQFEVTDSLGEAQQERGGGIVLPASGANADVREASEGAERGA